MLVKRVFFFGRTGSGKSTSVRFLTEEAERAGWKVQSFNDYPILRRKFLNDREHRQFRPTDHGGFEVLDFQVYEESLRELNDQLLAFRPTQDKTLITVEFSSNNYRKTLELFDPRLLQDAHLIFLAADLVTCLNRVSQRTAKPETADDYFVDDKVLLTHYHNPYMPASIDGNRVTLIHNMDSKEELRRRIHMVAKELLDLHEEDKVTVTSGEREDPMRDGEREDPMRDGEREDPMRDGEREDTREGCLYYPFCVETPFAGVFPLPSVV